MLKQFCWSLWIRIAAKCVKIYKMPIFGNNANTEIVFKFQRGLTNNIITLSMILEHMPNNATGLSKKPSSLII